MAKTEKLYPRVHTQKHELFTFVELAKGKVVICVGNHQVCEKSFANVTAAKQHADAKTWELICNVASVVAQETYKQLKQKEHETNEENNA